MKIVCKLGGACIQEGEDLTGLLNEIAALVAQGHKIVLVHGGGDEISRLEKLQQVASHKRDGMRITSAQTLQIVAQAMNGVVGPRLALTAGRAGLKAVGLCAATAGLLEACELAEGYGAVARRAVCRPALLDQLTASGYLPVVAPLAATPDSQLLNFNADLGAATIAIGFGADLLVLLSDVDGVMTDGKLVHRLSLADIDEQIAGGVIAGGMIPKVRAAQVAASSGSVKVAIGNGGKRQRLADIVAGKQGGYTRVISA